MALSEIVSVQIQAGTVSPASKGFGVPLLLGFHAAWAGSEVRRYTTFSGVAEDFDPHEWPYLAAQKIFSQKRRPREIKIARLPTPGTGQIVKLDFTDHPTATAVTGTVTSPAGVETAINVAWNTDLATTLAAVDTAIEAAIGAGSVATASPVLTVTVPTAVAGVAHFDFPTAYERETSADQDYDDALAMAAGIDPDWYLILTDTGSPKNIDKIARWAASNDRLYIAGPQYGDPSDFVSGEFSAGADYTALLANDAAAGLFTGQPRDAAIEAGWAGYMASFDPGSATWAFKTIAATGADAWTATQRGVIETTNHGNHYTTEARIGITRPGKTFGGEWIDVVLGKAWIVARMEERIFALLASAPKVDYTNEGFGQIVAVVRGVLRDAEKAKILARGSWNVTITPAEEQTAEDKALRAVSGLEFTGTLAGAVHAANLVGTLTF